MKEKSEDNYTLILLPDACKLNYKQNDKVCVP